MRIGEHQGQPASIYCLWHERDILKSFNGKNYDDNGRLIVSEMACDACAPAQKAYTEKSLLDLMKNQMGWEDPDSP